MYRKSILLTTAGGVTQAGHVRHALAESLVAAGCASYVRQVQQDRSWLRLCAAGLSTGVVAHAALRNASFLSSRK
jgi:hypothetical protein